MSRFWSSVVHNLSPYVPGEQPKIDGLIKLNTNENPYPPSPEIVEGIARRVAELGKQLNRYPDREFVALREQLAGYLDTSGGSGIACRARSASTT